MFADNPLKVASVPVPLIVLEPTDSVTVQVPEFGKPVSATEPVDTEQVGWVIVPMPGWVGVEGCAPMTAPTEDAEVQPPELVTVNVGVVD